MAGEALEHAEIGLDGVAGDRLVVVRGPHGIVTSRTRPRLLGLRATLSPDREPLVENRPAALPEVAAVVQNVAGPDTQLATLDTTARFDVLPMLAPGR